MSQCSVDGLYQVLHKYLPEWILSFSEKLNFKCKYTEF